MTERINYPGGNELLNPKELLNKLGVGYGVRLADLGCGSMAYFSLQASRLIGDRGQIYAVDILREVLSNVEGRLQIAGITNVKTIWSDLEQYGATKIAPATLDFALLVNVLFQIKDRLTVLKETERLLRPGGKLLVVDWKSIGAPFGPPQALRVSPGQIKEIAAQVGLKIQEEFSAGSYHFGQIYSK